MNNCCYNLSLCIICKDDAEHIKRLVKRARPYVGEIIVVDTGSTDNSVQNAIDAGADIVEFHPELLDDLGILRSFSEARELSYSLATKPWRLWLDTDDDLSDWEVLQNDIQTLDYYRKSYLDTLDAINLRMNYKYSWNDDGVCVQEFTRERITHRDDGWSWYRPIHEILQLKEKTNIALTSKIEVIHLSKGARAMVNDRNYHILKNWEAHPEICAEHQAMNYYLSDELYHRQRYNEAYEYALKVIGSNHYFEDLATLKISYCLINQRRYTDAIQFMTNTLQEKKDFTSLHWTLAHTYLFVDKLDEANEIMINTYDKEVTWTCDPTFRDRVKKQIDDLLVQRSTVGCII